MLNSHMLGKQHWNKLIFSAVVTSHFTVIYAILTSGVSKLLRLTWLGNNTRKKWLRFKTATHFNVTCVILWRLTKNGLNSHFQGAKHKSMVEKQNIGGMNKVSTFFCEMCDIVASDKNGLNSHLQGDKHKSMVEKQKICGTNKVSTFFCETCSVQCGCQSSYDAHISGKSHAKKLTNVENKFLKNFSRDIFGS